ncbi:radical SAM protein [Streptacidiphilus sp. P02-A3a]|uniref:radical SAM protein n=1 Tax=Streptacidiphilus sp. P02-A3a TaxID=2704468 RepID=UPI0015F8A7D9|nr:radical SAM protein [Streptacidiphilus sp. P02-A3a]QMU73235.1 radical SAM protein [Streptacidiphilus sp. P02-A3a]
MKHDELDLVSKLYQRTIHDPIAEVGRGGTLDGPLVVDLDPTTFCDLACPECISGQLLNQGRFTKERLRELVGEFISVGVRAVVLIGGGEPLAHPGTRDVIRLLGEAGIAVGVVTNGTMLDRHAAELGSYAHWVRVSVDAATEQTYGRFRPDRKGRSVFNQVIENMRGHAAIKTGTLGYSFLLMVRDLPGGGRESNHTEVLAAARLAKSIGCDYFELKTLFDEQHHIVGLSPEVLESVREQLAQARDLADDRFRIVCSSTFESVDQEVGPTQVKEYATCRTAELRTLVTPSGVYVCSYHRGADKARLGDAATEDFRKIWLDRPRSIIDPSRDCRFHCARHQTNLEVVHIGRRPEPPNLVDDYDLFL